MDTLTAEREISADMPLPAQGLACGLRDLMIQLIRDKVGLTGFSYLGEESQRKLADQIEAECARVVSRACGIVASEGFDYIPTTIESYAVKGGVAKLVITAAASREIQELLVFRTGQAATLVFVDPGRFNDRRWAADIDPDQPELAMGDSIGRPGDDDNAPEPDPEPDDDQGSPSEDTDVEAPPPENNDNGEVPPEEEIEEEPAPPPVAKRRRGSKKNA